MTLLSAFTISVRATGLKLLREEETKSNWGKGWRMKELGVEGERYWLELRREELGGCGGGR